jgi:hypothetical protein
MRGAIHTGTFWHPEDGTIYVVGPDREVWGRKHRGAPVTLHSGYRTMCGGPGKVTKRYWGELTAMHSSAYRGSSPPRDAQAPPRRGQVHMRTYADARIPMRQPEPPAPPRGFKQPGRGGRGRPIRRPSNAPPVDDWQAQLEDQWWLEWETAEPDYPSAAIAPSATLAYAAVG